MKRRWILLVAWALGCNAGSSCASCVGGWYPVATTRDAGVSVTSAPVQVDDPPTSPVGTSASGAPRNEALAYPSASAPTVATPPPGPMAAPDAATAPAAVTAPVATDVTPTGASPALASAPPPSTGQPAPLFVDAAAAPSEAFSDAATTPQFSGAQVVTVGGDMNAGVDASGSNAAP